MRKNIPGLLLVMALAGAGFLLDHWVPAFNAVLWALLLGVFMGNIASVPDTSRQGIDLGSKEILNLSVVFLGFDVSARQIGELGWSTLGIIVVMILSILSLTYLLARLFRCRTTTGWLVGFGTAICGSSAIAALSGSVTSHKEDVGIALAVVNLLGLLGMLLWPALLPLLDQPAQWSGMLIGGTLHAVGNVAGAGYALSDEVGQMAITIKLGRVALLAPGLIFFNWMVNRQSGGLEAFRLPYYVWGFIAVVVLISFLPVQPVLLQAGKMLGKILLTVAMAAIGLKISLAKLFQTGRIALGFGIVIFLIQTFLFIGLMSLL